MPSITERHLNLVFQGGGVKGIAYAGALDAMPRHCKVRAVGGTSAGAIAAAFVALGITGPDLKKTLSDPALFSLLDPDENRRVAGLTRAFEELRVLASSGIGLWAAWRWWRRNSELLTEARTIWQQRGLYKSDRLRAWLDTQLGTRRFNDIAVDDLKIVAADINRRTFTVFDRKRHPDKFIAEAVHASASIPLFFTPFQSGPLNLVDGGILSNYPRFLFAQGKYPTVGFRLPDIAMPSSLSTTWDYLKALIFTMAEAHDKQFDEPPYFSSYEIKIPSDISATKFDLTTKDADSLYEAGRVAGAAVDWIGRSSVEPIVPFYDPRPHETLHLSLTQAHRLWQQYASEDLQVESLHHEVTFSIKIEQDWSTYYDRVSTLTVSGSKSLFMSRAKIHGMSSYVQSLADVNYVCEEITDHGPVNLIHVPAINDELSKGYVIFYVPPVSEGQPSRTFRTSFGIPREFERIRNGQEDLLSYSTRPLARNHRLRLRVKVMLDLDLPDDIVLEPDFGATSRQSPAEVDENSKRSYRVREFELAERRVTDLVTFSIIVRRKDQHHTTRRF